MVEEILITILGTVAGVLVLSAFIPQVLKSYRRKRMDDVSTFLMILIILGTSMWVIYGIYRNDIVIVGTNLAAMALNLVLLGMKIKYGKRESSFQKK